MVDMAERVLRISVEVSSSLNGPRGQGKFHSILGDRKKCRGNGQQQGDSLTKGCDLKKGVHHKAQLTQEIEYP